jgi:ABC-type Zn uptake system ZnuABC Zn-binding protein ZnuA
MKVVYIHVIIHLIIVAQTVLAAPPRKQIVCTHPIICALTRHTVELLSSKKVAEQVDFISPVKGVTDPHHFEPGVKVMKKMLSATNLVAGPRELQYWEGQLKRWRTKQPHLNTIYLELPRKLDDLYGSNNRHALAHFWLYPKLLCLFEKKLVTNLHLLGIEQVNSRRYKGCSYLTVDRKAAKAFSLLQKRLVIVTHDALLPWLKRSKINAHSITSSDHHQELTSSQIKQLVQLLRKKDITKPIWIIEDSIPLPDLIKQQIGPQDTIINFSPWNIERPDSKPTAPLLKLLQSLKRTTIKK